MALKNSRELEATRDKLRLLEDRFEALRAEDAGDSHIREWTLRSLKKIINQLKEEIARYKAHHGIATSPEN